MKFGNIVEDIKVRLTFQNKEKTKLTISVASNPQASNTDRPATNSRPN
jgi:hypothetical protein